MFSQSLQAWMLGNDPGPRSSVISACYSAELAERDSRKTRDLIESPWYHGLFPNTILNPEFRTAANWETTKGGTRASAGVGGTLTGKGADHLIVDDPIKPQESNSEIVRARANEWFGETMRSRLNDPKSGTITIIMQRLHEEDLTGYLLRQMEKKGADQYTHISLPNEIAATKTYSFPPSFSYTRQSGELLHPDRLDETETAALQVALGVNYEGQYNQRPTKMEGDFFQWKWLNTYRKLPPLQYIYQAWDFAVSEKQTQKQDPDYSVCVTVGLDHSGRYYLVDLYRERVNSGVLIDSIIAQHRKHKPRLVWGEKGVIEKSIAPFFMKRCHELSYYMVLDGVAPGKADKVERAASIRGVMSTGNFYIPEAHKHLPDLMVELTGFPRGAHDDIVDALAYIGLKLQSIRETPVHFNPQQTVQDPTRVYGSDLIRASKQQALARAPKLSSLHLVK